MRSKKKMKKYFVTFLVYSLMLSNIGQTNELYAKTKTTKLKLNYTKKKIEKGKKIKLKVTKKPTSMGKVKFIWKSGNKRVASVSKKGTVYAKRKGKTTIKVYVKGNKKICAKCIVTVTDKNKKPNNNSQGKDQSNSSKPAPTDTSGQPGGTPKPTVTASPDASKQPETQKPTVTTSPDVSEQPETPTVSPETTEQPELKTYTVTFVDYNGLVLAEKKVLEGEDVIPPDVPKRIGYNFCEWSEDCQNISEDTVIRAIYEKDTTPAIIVDDVMVKKGTKSIDVPIYINENPGILGMTLSLQYDDSVMKLVRAVNGDAVKDVLTLTTSNKLGNDCKFTWDGQDISDEDIKDGAIIILSFSLNESINVGEYDIVLYFQNEDIIDKNLQLISIELRNGKIIVKE